MRVIFIQQTEFILIIQQSHITYSLTATSHHDIELIVLAEVSCSFLKPAYIGVKVGLRTMFILFQLRLRILQGQSVIIQGFVLRHGISVGI